MAWITPITDRTTGAICTYIDMNRIAGNLDYLATELNARQLYYGATIIKTTYNNNDYVSLDDWENILEVLEDLMDALLPDSAFSATMERTYDNFNTVESLTLAVYDWFQLLLSQANNNHYSGDNIYSGSEPLNYSGGLAA